MSLSASELERYARHLNLAEIGREGQEKIKNAKVLCVGLGGLGCPLSLYLAKAGVGTLGLIDDDNVSLANLQRQVLYTDEDIGASKVRIASEKLKKANPCVEIQSFATRLTSLNAYEIIPRYDIIADCSDNFETGYLLSDACCEIGKPNVYASVLAMEGQCSIFSLAKGPCYRCLFPEPPPVELRLSCKEVGIFSVLPGLVALIQASEIVKLILNIGQPLIGKLLTINAVTMQFSEFKIEKKCSKCLSNFVS